MKQVRIKNIGPISDAVINIKALTVFGGINNTGKSFALRLIYSLFKSLQNDLYCQRANTLIDSLQHPILVWKIEEFIDGKRKENKKTIHAMKSILNLVSCLTAELDSLDLDDLSSTGVKKLLAETIDGIMVGISELDTAQANEALNEILNLLNTYLDRLHYFSEQINLTNVRENFSHFQLKENIEHELMENFQIPGISVLFGHGNSTPSVRLADQNARIEFTLSRQSRESQIGIGTMNQIRLYPSNLFLESPVYWKLEAFLNNGFGPMRSGRHRELSSRHPIVGMPDYASSLRSELATDLTGDVAFPEISEWIHSNSVLGGRIVLSTAGQLRFSDGEGNYPLPTTASGIANIGMLGLLIERKLINERTVLFIDGPESNLHTAWQVVMAELLMKLSQSGVQVIIATHSAEIIKYIANCAKHDDQFAEHVALNSFPNCRGDDQDFQSQLANMLEILTEPYLKLYLAGT